MGVIWDYNLKAVPYKIAAVCLTQWTMLNI